jgi:hypothetical protein
MPRLSVALVSAAPAIATSAARAQAAAPNAASSRTVCRAVPPEVMSSQPCREGKVVVDGIPLRRKLDPEHSRYIVNCWGIGYRLIDG